MIVPAWSTRTKKNGTPRAPEDLASHRLLHYDGGSGQPLRLGGADSVAGRMVGIGNGFAGGVFLGAGLIHMLADAGEHFEAAGGVWVDTAGGSYVSYDGSHLEMDSARRLSRSLARPSQIR